jgi:nucleotide-binding universal stress UspA family protein
LFTRILVPLDGSTLAERALPIAARIARASAARLLLVCAAAVPATYGFMYGGETVRWNLVRDETEQARAYLGEMARSALLASLPVDCTAEVGTAADVILDTAAERGADLVVMTSHGRTGLGRWVLGSVAEHVVHHPPAPVLVLRGRDAGDVDVAGPEAEHQRRILVPLDGSPLAEAALAPARALALALAAPGAADLHLMLVVTPYEAVRANMPDALIVDGARAYLERMSQRLLADGGDDGRLAVTWSVVVSYDFAHGILAVAEAKGADQVAERTESAAGTGSPGSCDAIAMATHGFGGLARWALGSVTERVLHATHLPLLIVRPQDMQENVARARSQ